MRKVERVREQRRRRSRTSFLRKRGREGEREEVDTELDKLKVATARMQHSARV